MVKLSLWPSSSFQLIANINSELAIATKKICNKLLIVILKIFFFMFYKKSWFQLQRKIFIPSMINYQEHAVQAVSEFCELNAASKNQNNGAAFTITTRLSAIPLKTD